MLSFAQAFAKILKSTSNTQITLGEVYRRREPVITAIRNDNPNSTQVNRMSRSRRVLAIGGKHCDYGWIGSVFIHFYYI